MNHLPPESAVNTAIRNSMPASNLARDSDGLDPARANWSSIETLTALLIDEVRQQTWVYIQSKSPSAVPRPSPIPRPGLPERALRPISLAAAQVLDPRLRGLSEEEAQDKLDAITGGNRRR